MPDRTPSKCDVHLDELPGGRPGNRPHLHRGYWVWDPGVTCSPKGGRLVLKPWLVSVARIFGKSLKGGGGDCLGHRVSVLAPDVPCESAISLA